MTKISVWALLISIVLVSCGCTNTSYNTSGRVVVQDEHSLIDIAFSDHDRMLIHEYYSAKSYPKKKHLPPGLAKKGKIPPGHQKQLVRQGHLPPGLDYQHLPANLELRLSTLPEGYVRVMVDGSFILFNENTRLIFDIFHES